mgnify:CR=1 FL=1
MKKYKNLTKSIIPIFLIGVVLFPVMFLKFQPVKYNYNYHNTHPMPINTSSTVNMTNAEIIDEIFTKYIDHHGEYGYYPSYYTPSMQGTYYALSILSALDRMDSINQSHLSKYIMDHYNASSGIFMDDYARRYLDTDFSMRYYALSSLLEVNAYAILSLHLLGKVYLIDFHKTFNFIWDCFNSTLGGFAGRQLNPNLSPYFNQPTLDNTYYAVKTLDLLLDSWEGYTTEKSANTEQQAAWFNFIFVIVCAILLTIFIIYYKKGGPDREN